VTRGDSVRNRIRVGRCGNRSVDDDADARCTPERTPPRRDLSFKHAVEPLRVSAAPGRRAAARRDGVGTNYKAHLLRPARYTAAQMVAIVRAMDEAREAAEKRAVQLRQQNLQRVHRAGLFGSRLYEGVLSHALDRPVEDA
jgi:hypothetical protein